MSGPVITTRKLGREAHTLITIDDFATDPDALRATGITADYEPGRNHYPGIRARLPASYLATQLPIITEALSGMFGRAVDVEVHGSSFSIVTTPQASLTLKQRMPHIDAIGPERIALIHYLSPEGGDGTAFFRHRATGFEAIDRVRKPIYFGQLEAEIRDGGEPPYRYMSGDTSLFECHTLAEARYNRAYLYRSFQLHSGAISADTVLSADPAQGRLTVTGFLSVK